MWDVSPGVRIRTYVGPSAILASYERNHPANITTFDWFEYRNFQGDEAYINAVKDGYFNIIELEDESKSKNLLYQKVHLLVKQNLTDSYHLVYAKDNSYVYRREY